MDHHILVTDLIIPEQGVLISLHAFVRNGEAHGNGEMSYSFATCFEEMLGRNESALIVIGHYFRRLDAIAYAIKKYQRNISLL